MIRKSLIALAAIATLGAAALAPTAASAKGFKLGFKHHHHHFHGHHHHYGHRYFGRVRYGVTVIGSDCYWTKKLTRWGTIRPVKVCVY